MKVERKEGSAFKNLVDTAKVLKTGTSLRVGFFENSVYPNGQKVAEVATIQEYGAPSKNIPPRPFMRPTQENHGNEWMQALGMGLRADRKSVV